MFDLDLIKKTYENFGPRIDKAREVLKKPLTLSEKILYTHLFEPEKVRHHSEAFQYGKTYAGDMKYWHINTFVIDNR